MKSQKVRTVLKGNLIGIDQAKIGLVEQRGGLERVARMLPHHIDVSEGVHFIVHPRDEPVQ
jgi:hypothetical protein